MVRQAHLSGLKVDHKPNIASASAGGRLNQSIAVHGFQTFAVQPGSYIPARQITTATGTGKRSVRARGYAIPLAAFPRHHMPSLVAPDVDSDQWVRVHFEAEAEIALSGGIRASDTGLGFQVLKRFNTCRRRHAHIQRICRNGSVMQPGHGISRTARPEAECAPITVPS